MKRLDPLFLPGRTVLRWRVTAGEGSSQSSLPMERMGNSRLPEHLRPKRSSKPRARK